MEEVARDTISASAGSDSEYSTQTQPNMRQLSARWWAVGQLSDLEERKKSQAQGNVHTAFDYQVITMKQPTTVVVTCNK